MKTVLVTAGALTLLASGTALAQGDKIDLMPGGVVCDKAEQICYDQRGANAPETRRMFGEYAGQEVQKHLFDAPMPQPR